MKPAKRIFISHVSEEAGVATTLKEALSSDFLGLVDIFVSSDAQSIAAGEDWLHSIETALENSALLLILCSPQSIKRPWINFEAGAAWMRKIPLVPLCHAGLTPHDLPMPLSLRQGVLLADADGLSRLYARVANVIQCNSPMRSFVDLATKFGAMSHISPQGSSGTAELDRERRIRRRMTEALQDSRWKWRSLDSVADAAGISEELAADLLRGDDEVRFSKGESGVVIVGLRSRV